jgi:uncharacterized protein YuzE
MKIIYNPASDVMRIVFRDAPVEDFTEEQPNMQIDYDVEDKIVALEIRHASTLMDNPHQVEHQILEE